MSSDKDKPEETKRSSVKKKSSSKKPSSTTETQNDNSTQAILALKEGLINLHHQNDARMSAQEDRLADLYHNLEGAFKKIHLDTGKRETHSDSTIDQLSTTIIRSSEEMRKEYEEMEKLQEKRLAAENLEYSHSIKRTKIIAIPAIILAFVALIYMFYTVNVMEKAMTQMSKDMTHMRQDMSVLTQNVSTMSANIGGMRHDMNIMTHNVAPAMSGMRRMMPWSP